MTPTEELKFVSDMLNGIAKNFPRFAPAITSCVQELKEEEEHKNRYRSDYSRIFFAIDNGIRIDTEIQTITGIGAERLDQMLDQMVEAGVLITLPQGGKPEKARGRRKILYMRSMS